MVAHTRTGCVWLLVLGACVSLVRGAECGKECALCVFRVLGQESTFSSLTCSLECDGELDSQKVRLCRDILLEEESYLPLEVQQQESVGDMAADDDGATLPEHQLDKKYGGFMKRYGGFMARRSSSPQVALQNPENPNEEENVRVEILKMLNAAADQDGEGGGPEGEAVKRYGGFMRRAGGELLEAVLGRGLKKRYGGFMRRVGRPEWLVDNSKSVNGGVFKRAWESGSELQKRYGGFMD
ncbi:proenkephalin-A-like [Thalassophryne amazonica]|uniref:proenkephalin-A-like n=1 Tax=Thalassophryne amazonica TaxID=390379 RepID=UPI0014719BB9|nr:proenkephalin-A-like [Thalassophryne amazonica]